jgi:hypothetical protein
MNKIRTGRRCPFCDGTGYIGAERSSSGKSYNCNACRYSGIEHLTVIEYLKRIKWEHNEQHDTNK